MLNRIGRTALPAKEVFFMTDKLWWERVPNATAFISDIVKTLLDGKSTFLQHENALPWYDTMFSMITEAIVQQDSAKRMEKIDNVDSPGTYFLRGYCTPEIRAAYRPAKSAARFLAESDNIVLHTRYFWVRISTADMLTTWVDFVSEYIKYRTKGKDTAVFLLEWEGEKTVLPRKGLIPIAYEDYVNAYDSTVFAMLASSDGREPDEIKNYAAELAAALTGNDSELCGAVCQCRDAFLANPQETIRQITEEYCRSDGRDFAFYKSEEEIQYNIWQAQVKTFYSFIEEFRADFVKRYGSVIENGLPLRAPWGEDYTAPKDVELGPIVYLADQGKIHFKRDVYDELKRFKEARNMLSHRDILTLDEIRALVAWKRCD